MRREVLRLVDDEIHFAQGTPADIGQRRNEKFLFPHHGVQFLGLLAAGLVAVLDDLQVVHERQDVGTHLGLLVSGEVADILAAQYHGGPGKDNLVVVVGLFQGGRQGDERLARAGASREGHQGNLGIEAGVQGKLLLIVAGTDAGGRLGTHQGNDPARGIVSATNRLPSEEELVQLVGTGLLLGDLLPGNAVVLPVGQALGGFGGGFHRNHFLLQAHHHLVVHAVFQVVLGFHAHGLGLQAQVNILGDQGHEALRVMVPHPHGGGEDAVVLGVVLEKILEFGGEGMVGFQFDETQAFS